MEWIEVAIRTTREAAEAVANRLLELRGGGVVIDDPNLIYEYREKYSTEQTDFLFDLPEPDFQPNEVVVKAYFPAFQVDERQIAELKAWVSALDQYGLDPGPVEVSSRVVNEEDWANSWKEYYHPVQISDRLIVKPSWEDCDASGAVVIDIDPGMAFGTGTHPTTVLCLQGIEKYLQPGDQVFDIGTGSGILAVAAAKLGARCVEAVDIDPVAVQVAQENAERNQVAGLIRVRQGTVDDISGQADLIMANIIASIIIDIAPQLAARLVPGGICLASGIIDQKAADVETALEAVGLEIIETRRSGEWVLLVARKPNQVR